jgi:triosephosphate isomerase
VSSKQIIAGNWKMNKTLREGLDLTQGLLEGLRKLPAHRTMMIFPPATLLHPISQRIGDRNLDLGAQDLSWERQGAFTGEISPLQILDAGCSCVLVGHSERRHVIQESEERIRLKLRAGLENGLRAILCIGEKLEERENERTVEILTAQLASALEGMAEIPRPGFLTVAYEPVWAIGTGITAAPEQAQAAHEAIRGLLEQRWGEPGREIQILYGGSVKPDNAGELLSLEDVDGVLVGGASLEAKTFLAIARA